MSKGSGLGAIEKPYHGPIQSGKICQLQRHELHAGHFKMNLN